MNKKYLILIVIAIFFLSVAVRYWPIYHKGYSFRFNTDGLVLARNLDLTGEYKIDNSKSVVLSSTIVQKDGAETNVGNKLNQILYGKLFGLLGFNKQIPLWFSLFAYGMISVLFFLLVTKIFNFKIGLIFAFIDIFSPLVLQNSMFFGTYEWAMLFLVIALFIYLYKDSKLGLIKLLFVGFFMAIASLTRNSFLIVPFVFVIYDFIRNRSFKRAIIFILPVLILWGAYLLPGILAHKSNSAYLSSDEETRDYLHIFPDPYTWYFDRGNFVKEAENNSNYTYSEYLLKYGYNVSLKNKLLMYFASAESYPEGLVAQTVVGGPIIVFFMFLGVWYLYKNKKELLILFLCWILILYGFLIIAKSNHWGHFLQIEFPLVLLAALGIYSVFCFVSKQNFSKVSKYLIIFGFSVALLFHLIQSDKWMLHENYLYTNTDKVMELVKIVDSQKNNMDKKNDVIAIGSPDSNAPTIINWYTDFSSVYFDPQTIKKLIKENKLKWAFDQFGVTKIIGYDEILTKEILQSTSVRAVGI